MGEAKVDMGKDDAAKRNERNQLEHLVIEEILKVVWHLLMTQKQEDTIQKVEV